MSNSHYYFGLVVGALIMALGAGLSTVGPAGWSLATVGLIIFSISLLNRYKLKLAFRPVRIE